MTRIPGIMADVIKGHWPGLPQAAAATHEASLDAVLSPAERGHKRGLAAAASAVEATIHEIDGRWPQRAEAYEIARKAVSAYIAQIGQAHGGTR